MAVNIEGKEAILIAVDSSEHSERAFNFYADNLHSPNNYVLVLHCPELTNLHLRMTRGESTGYDRLQKLYDEQQQATDTIQQKYTQKLKDRKMEGSWLVIHSVKPGESIVEAAEMHKVTTIITGTRGLGKIRRTILGSVSDYIIHHAHCPVVVVRE